jgi:hypothetical protein
MPPFSHRRSWRQSAIIMSLRPVKIQFFVWITAWQGSDLKAVDQICLKSTVSMKIRFNLDSTSGQRSYKNKIKIFLASGQFYLHDHLEWRENYEREDLLEMV